MNSSPIRISNCSEYDCESDFLDSAINRNCLLPRNPFLWANLTYRFDEFDWTLSDEFWRDIQCLSNSLNDEVLMAVLSPDPVDYYKMHFGHYEWARLRVAMSSQQYWGFINESPADSAADSILSVAEKIAWIPKSKNWCVWAERDSGICVIANNGSQFGNMQKGVEWAVDRCRPWATTSFLEQLEQNFGETLR